MILDSSAMVAVVLAEEDAGWFAERMLAATTLGVGAPTLVEAGIVLTARAVDAPLELDELLTADEVDVISFGAGHWRVALDAFERFGTGRHRARLNLGDCFAYATAKLAQQPLLCRGDDFAHTDLETIAP